MNDRNPDCSLDCSACPLPPLAQELCRTIHAIKLKAVEAAPQEQGDILRGLFVVLGVEAAGAALARNGEEWPGAVDDLAHIVIETARARGLHNVKDSVVKIDVIPFRPRPGERLH